MHHYSVILEKRKHIVSKRTVYNVHTSTENFAKLVNLGRFIMQTTSLNAITNSLLSMEICEKYHNCIQECILYVPTH